jgi:uncharacterized membrane protein YdjX (TVP38/TMEM64 family)
VVLTCLAVVICDAIFFQSHHVKKSTNNLLSWTYNNDGLALGLYILMLTLLTSMLVPPSLLVLAGGFIFHDVYGLIMGPVITLISSLVGVMFGGMIAFLRAPSMSRALLGVVSDRYPILSAVDTAIVKNPLKVMFLMRLNSLIPFGVLNYVFAMKDVDDGLFLVSIVAVLPWYLFLVSIGAGFSFMYNGYGYIGTIVGVVCSALVLVIVWRIAKEELQKEVEPSGAPDDDITATTELEKETMVASSGKKSKSWTKKLKTKLSRKGKDNKKNKLTVGENEQVVVADDNIIENSDLSGADYVNTQILGKDGGNGIYRTKLGLPEIIADDFS